jgi:hypothetical protein
MALISSKQILQPVELTGSYTGSFFGTFTGIVNGTGGGGGGGSFIATGSVTASVDVSGNIFLIKSGSSQYATITNNTTTLINDIFIISNKNNIPLFKISESIAYFNTQSTAPVKPTTAGGIYFTSSSFYVGLE